MQEQRTSFLEGLAPVDLANIQDGLERRHFPAGSTVIAEGDALHEIYIIQSGAVEVVIADQRGGEHLVNRLGPGATLGEMSLFTGQPTSATVRASVDLVVSVLREEDFARVAAAHP